MKKYTYIFLSALFALTVISCSTEDKFSGSPVGNVEIVTLTGTITTTVENALTDQEVEFTASLPDGKVFNDTVTVEVTTLRSDGGRVRGYYDIMPGQTSITDKIAAVGGLVYDTTFELSMTAINLQTVEPGIHYLLTSNKISINTGNNSIPEAESDRLKIRFVWENPSSSNKFKCWIKKPGVAADIEGNNFTGSAIDHVIKTVSTTSNGNGSLSSKEGEYIFKLASDLQPVSPENKKYRIILVFPNGDVTVYNGRFDNLTQGNPEKKDVLKITKVGSGDDAVFNLENLNPL
ncbi:MAG: hypothetical protein IPP30_10975 [Flavobacterium sp.]|nr:hypothetical protein [Flavobacterium sp.]